MCIVFEVVRDASDLLCALCLKQLVTQSDLSRRKVLVRFFWPAHPRQEGFGEYPYDLGGLTLHEGEEESEGGMKAPLPLFLLQCVVCDRCAWCRLAACSNHYLEKSDVVFVQYMFVVSGRCLAREL